MCGLFGTMYVSLNRTGATALTTGFTNGNGVIWLDDVNCRGTETTLNACTHPAYGVHNCVHGEDAGVRCAGMSLSQDKVYIATFPVSYLVS